MCQLMFPHTLMDFNQTFASGELWDIELVMFLAQKVEGQGPNWQRQQFR